MSVLAVEDLRVRLRTPAGEVTIVDGVSYEVQAGEVFGVAGESGSGKTVSMLALLGLLPEGALVGGTARFGGDDLLAMPRRRLRKISGRELAMVFQDPFTSLHPMLSVGRQLTDHVRLHLGVGRAAAEARAVELLEEVRLPDPQAALGRFPHQFSGGMRQRIAIAIALACRPRLLIADEPTTALDVTVQAGILRLLDRLRREHDLAVILITHDLGVLSGIADRVGIFYAGRVVELGRREDVLQRPRHPYTRALLDALPHPELTKEQDLVAIGGTPPTPGRIPPGLRLPPEVPLRAGRMRRTGPAARAHRPAPARLPHRPVRSMSALELTDVVVDYHGRDGTVRAVAGASLSVDRGRIVGLVGESGCGKSSLARAAVGLVPAAAGSVAFEGRPVTTLTRRARPTDLVRLQLVFQNPYSSLNPRRTVGSQVADGAANRQDRRADRRSLELVGLSANAATRYPHEFSGGQRQRIAIARALAADPSVIVLDEPLASLDASAQAQLANLLTRLSRELELGLLLISHDLAIVRHVADEVCVMYLGRMVETGPTLPLWRRPAHPYSEALIAAVPHADGEGTCPEALPGEVPDPSRPPSGCRFHPRCPYAFERCRSEEPPLLELADGREAACWLQQAGQPAELPATRAANFATGANVE